MVRIWVLSILLFTASQSSAVVAYPRECSGLFLKQISQQMLTPEQLLRRHFRWKHPGRMMVQTKVIEAPRGPLKAILGTMAIPFQASNYWQIELHNASLRGGQVEIDFYRDVSELFINRVVILNQKLSLADRNEFVSYLLARLIALYPQLNRVMTFVSYDQLRIEPEGRIQSGQIFHQLSRVLLVRQLRDFGFSTIRIGPVVLDHRDREWGYIIFIEQDKRILDQF